MHVDGRGAPGRPAGGSEALIPLAALINRSVELIVQPDAHDVVCEMRVRRYGSAHWCYQTETRVTDHAGKGVTVCQLAEIARGMSAFGGNVLQNSH